MILIMFNDMENARITLRFRLNWYSDMLSRNCCIPWRVGANDYQVKMGSKTKTYHVNILKKYIAREPDTAGNVVLKM